MSSAVPSKRDRRPNSLPSGRGVLNWLEAFLRSSVGNKLLVALTGLGLTTFVFFHMLGNLQVFAGQDKLNGYAKWLKDLGPLLWVARIGLLTIFVLHVFLAIRLKMRARQARPVPYAHKETIQASIGSRTMLFTGLVILAFVLFHLAHFTFCVVTDVTAYNPVLGKEVMTSYVNLIDEKGRHDVYRMVVDGFRNPVISAFYLAAQLLLLLHLSHGVASVFQTLGWNSPRVQPFVRRLGWAVALIVALGNVLIILAVWIGAAGADTQLPPLTRAGLS